ncbi:MAG: CapA family protein [Hydrococcus sp. C42_A2020_068]|uniref:CapA family protein n=1 Tax=Pleurocapsa sp. PCC 7327 TaxID=118163 RepID=UPI00029FC79A|nr:CapA family protein [Pleurocapsa sp. PCC 7327]AFY76076.1 putative enzyme of poly-gamma-glutamate biosynthesis (capsule formation) [Pleurocapsa sp. PCC 7327]MBF2021945.1 CapA family protein [Hydrococcus sp. C42_A2020_068]
MTNCITLFLCGDVMTGRGIDQILPHPSNPLLHEPYVKSAEEYVELAQEANGAIQYPVNFSDIWGDAIDEWERLAPDLRIVNLETSITTSEDYWEGKDIHYRMNPANIPCLVAAKIDCCSLANNHVLDWGYSGLAETLQSLKEAKIESAGAGRNLQAAEAPAMMEIKGKGRVIVFSFGLATSGIPFSWRASEERPGVNLLKDLSEATVCQISEQIRKIKRSRDIVVASIHWGGNWGYEIDRGQREFAHRLIERAGVDLVHGHSSHHIKGIEVYQDKLILYGCGDFLNDYEGVSGYEAFRDDLGLMYFARIEPLTGKLVSLQMTPTQIKRLRVNRALPQDAFWLRDVLHREGKRLGTQVELNPDRTLSLKWR